MNRLHTSTLVFFVASSAAGCTALLDVSDYEVGGRSDAAAPDASSPRDAGRDAGSIEPDAASAPDAGPPSDAGPPDGGPPAICSDVSHGCDLVISCSMPDPITGRGDTVRVPYMVTNLGTLSGAGPFDVRVQLERPDGTFEDVVTDRSVGIIGPLGSTSDEAAFVAPDWIRNGANGLRCLLDASDEIPETDEANNRSDTSVSATGRPDLQIISPSIPGSPGSTFTVAFDLRNAGPTAAGPFRYGISAGGDAGGGSCRSVMVPGLLANATVSESETINRADCGGFFPPGPGTVVIILDPGSGGGDVAESNETNNTFTRNVTW